MNSSRGDWQGDLTVLAKVAATHLPPADALFVNSGLWEAPQFNADVESATRQLAALSTLVKQGHPVWMTTTPVNSVTASPAAGGCGKDLGCAAAVDRLGWPVLDRHGMVMALTQQLPSLNRTRGDVWVDRVHFKAFVYQAFVNAALNMLCP